jgi:hypothetical protein
LARDLSPEIFLQNFQSLEITVWSKSIWAHIRFYFGFKILAGARMSASFLDSPGARCCSALLPPLPHCTCCHLPLHTPAASRCAAVSSTPMRTCTQVQPVLQDSPTATRHRHFVMALPCCRCCHEHEHARTASTHVGPKHRLDGAGIACYLDHLLFLSLPVSVQASSPFRHSRQTELHGGRHLHHRSASTKA